MNSKGDVMKITASFVDFSETTNALQKELTQ
jgi:hypothetical protein